MITPSQFKTGIIFEMNGDSVYRIINTRINQTTKLFQFELVECKKTSPYSVKSKSIGWYSGSNWTPEDYKILNKPTQKHLPDWMIK